VRVFQTHNHLGPDIRDRFERTLPLVVAEAGLADLHLVVPSKLIESLSKVVQLRDFWGNMLQHKKCRLNETGRLGTRGSPKPLA